MKKSLFATSILCATFAASAASAQPINDTWPNWYLGLSGGVAIQPDQDFVSNGTPGTAQYSEGYNVSGTLGYIVPAVSSEDGRVRLELEVGKSKNDSDGGAFTGKVENTFVATNVLYDVNTGTNLIPYFGAGVGVARIDVSPTNAAGANGQDNVPIAQGLVGVAYAPETLPRTELTLGYRYQTTLSDPDVDNSGAGRTEIEYNTHSAEAGVRLRF